VRINIKTTIKGLTTLIILDNNSLISNSSKILKKTEFSSIKKYLNNWLIITREHSLPKPSIILKSSVMQLMWREKKKCSLRRLKRGFATVPQPSRICMSLDHFATVHSIVFTMAARDIMTIINHPNVFFERVCNSKNTHFFNV